MQKLIALFLALLTFTTIGSALALELPEVDESADDLIDLDESELYERYAENDTNSLVLPEGSDTSLNSSFTILLVGSDSYNDDHRGRGDAIILVQVDGANRDIRLVSFMRDLYVSIPGHGSNRINASYIWGGEKLLRQTLEKNFSVTADAYMEVNFERMVKLIDGIGGVDVEVSEKERTQVNSILRFYNVQIGDPEEDQLLEDSGLVHLSGKQALCFSRIRKIDGDAQRTGRQRKVIEAAFHKVAALSLPEITQILVDNLDAVTTDLTLVDCMRLIPLAMQCRNATFETLTVPQNEYSTFVNGNSVIKARDYAKEKTNLLSFLGLNEE